MLQTFEARLKGNQLEWVDEKPLQAYKTSYPIDVYITFREKIPVEKSEPLQKQRITVETEDELRLRGQQMAEILQKIADTGGPDIDDPVAWQREIRCERSLPGRNNNAV